MVASKLTLSLKDLQLKFKKHKKKQIDSPSKWFFKLQKGF